MLIKCILFSQYLQGNATIIKNCKSLHYSEKKTILRADEMAKQLRELVTSFAEEHSLFFNTHIMHFTNVWK